ncbi:ABC transporter permease [Allochromatium humboldtianum]|uniref:ABC transporter permease n=1 Tax=Allochromatium humboldtianum TaxID=504901 RepID=UPI001CA408CA|nr:ABC transporter permease [Allochromatium humboldtianum]
MNTGQPSAISLSALPLTLLRELWAYRGFILASVQRELRARYLGSQFGLAWAVIHPFALILLYTLVFSNLMRPTLAGHDAPIAYSVYLCAGLLTWTVFSELLGRSVGIFVNNANLLKKVSFPKLTLPLIAILSSLLHYAIIMALFMAFLVLAGYFPGWVVFAAVPVILILVAFTVGLGLLAGTINVFYRDIEQFTALVLQFWFWFTPIVYVRSILPDWLSALLGWNPVLPMVAAMQSIFLDARAPDWSTLVYPLTLAGLLLVLGWLAYRRLGGEIVDEL